jgi:D-alanyl-D-alanine carboxypeptidase
VIGDLAQMAAAARDAGAAIGVASAYRSYWTQVSTFNSWVAETGYEDALLVSARPGHSEHQLGTTLDFKTAGGPDPWEVNFGSTAAGSWLRDNAWRYGFVMSYPYGPSPSVTCYGYEPWHFRYFGREVAAAIQGSGLSSREYLWTHGTAMEPPQTSSPAPTPRPRRTAASGSDRPARKPSSIPVVQATEPEPSMEPTIEIQLPEETPDALWPAGLVARSGGPPPEQTQATGSPTQPSERDGAEAEAATAVDPAQRGDPSLVGQLGVVAGLVVALAVESRARRTRPGIDRAAGSPR